MGLLVIRDFPDFLIKYEQRSCIRIVGTFHRYQTRFPSAIAPQIQFAVIHTFQQSEAPEVVRFEFHISGEIFRSRTWVLNFL